MPNFSGTWTIAQQMQARGASTWPAPPGAPTIGTATAGTNKCASVTFTAPACTGYPSGGITGYRLISTPGCFTATGASSPVVVTGLTVGTSYTFKAQATNSLGYGGLSAASNSITAALTTCATYTTAGTYSWVAPAGVTSVAVVAVGGGSFGGGGLGWKNSIATTPGSSYTVVVGVKCGNACGSGSSYFINTSTVKGGGAFNTTAGTYTGTGGGNGGGATNYCGYIIGGGGAGGYAGNGGNGATGSNAGSNGAGGGGGGGRGASGLGGCFYFRTGGGGGVGLFGQGANGAGASATGTTYGVGGGGGSGGANGTNDYGSGCTTRGWGGNYGGGHAGSNCGIGGSGAVRIVWCRCGARGTPSFPSTNVGA